MDEMFTRGRRGGLWASQLTSIILSVWSKSRKNAAQRSLSALRFQGQQRFQIGSKSRSICKHLKETPRSTFIGDLWTRSHLWAPSPPPSTPERCCARRRFGRSPARSRRRIHASTPRRRSRRRVDTRHRPAERPATTTTTATTRTGTARRADGRAPRAPGRAPRSSSPHPPRTTTTAGRLTSRISWPWRTATGAASRISAPPRWRWPTRGWRSRSGFKRR